jgi:hypothetical protein
MIFIKKYLNYVIFYLKLILSFIIHVPSLMTVEFFCHVTDDNLLQSTHGHVWSWTVARFQKPQSVYDLFDRHKNFISEVSVSLNLELITLGLTVPTDRN